MRSRLPAAAVLASALLLCLVLAAIVTNAIFVRTTVSSMCRITDTLPALPDANTTDTLDKLSALFDRHENGLSLSISFPILDRVREQIAATRAFAASGSIAEYAASLATLRDAIHDLDRLERFSVRNIM